VLIRSFRLLVLTDIPINVLAVPLDRIRRFVVNARQIVINRLNRAAGVISVVPGVAVEPCGYIFAYVFHRTPHFLSGPFDSHIEAINAVDILSRRFSFLIIRVCCKALIQHHIINIGANIMIKLNRMLTLLLPPVPTL